MSGPEKCPGCDHKVVLPTDLEGKQVRCPLCGAAFNSFSDTGPDASVNVHVTRADRQARRPSYEIVGELVSQSRFSLAKHPSMTSAIRWLRVGGVVLLLEALCVGTFLLLSMVLASETASRLVQYVPIYKGVAVMLTVVGIVTALVNFFAARCLDRRTGPWWTRYLHWLVYFGAFCHFLVLFFYATSVLFGRFNNPFGLASFALLLLSFVLTTGAGTRLHEAMRLPFLQYQFRRGASRIR